MKGVPADVTRGLPVGSEVLCVDNTGAQVLQITSVPQGGGVRRRQPAAGVGDKFIASVTKGTPEMRRQLIEAVIVRQKRPYRRPDGTMVEFEDNAAVIITPMGETKGSDIKGPVSREAAERWGKIAATASIIV